MFRNPGPLTRTGAFAPFHSRATASCAGNSASSQPVRRTTLAGLGIRCSGSAMQPAALRVLETTWRIWREPLG